MSVRTLIVDDSHAMQRLLSAVLESDPDIEVIGAASDPFEARSMIKQLDPDVLTLDIEMPKMDGLSFLGKIMKLRPMPVIMISSHTGRGTQLSLEALAQGAFGCLPKPRMDDDAAFRQICQLVKQAAQSSASLIRNATNPKSPSRSDHVKVSGDTPDLIVVGSSTGGVEALTSLFSKFPADCPPTVVTQHMPASFTTSFAERLNRTCAPRVQEAEDGATLERGNIYIAPGSVGHTTVGGNAVLRTRIAPGEPVRGHMPAVDYLFASAAECRRTSIGAALLTGMGSDGAAGMLKLRQKGARTIAQDEQTSLVYGMPAAAVKNGAAQQSLPLNKIAEALFGG